MRHRRKRKPHYKPVGTPPGTISPAPDARPSVIRVMAYGPTDFREETVDDVACLKDYLGKWPVLWIDVDGLGNAAVIEGIGALLKLHPLALEDVAHTQQRAKVDEFDNHLFIVARMLSSLGHGETEQLGIFLGQGFVVTFQEGAPGDNFGHIRDRLRKGVGRLRHLGPDALMYALLDALVDAYFPVLETWGERLEEIEDQIIASPRRSSVSQLYEAKRELLAMRRAVWPLREALNSLVRDETPLITPETRLFLRDCYDHAVRIIDLVETYRELASDLMDLYLSSISQRMNEIMKVLTIIATLFMPLTFISSIYGMNFDPDYSKWNMPELRWYLGYPFALLLMAIVGLAFLWYFRSKGWLRADDSSLQPPGATERDQRDRSS